MSDLALRENADGSFDLDFDTNSNDLTLTDDLFNAIAISIGTYARNRNLKAGVASIDPQLGGWWGDALDAEGSLGAYIYEAFPGKLTTDTADQLQDLVLEALAWMQKDGIAKKILANAELGTDAIDLTVTIGKPDGNSENYTYELNWMATNGI